MHTRPSSRSQLGRIRRPGRLTIIVLVGLVAMAASLSVRNSPWARERRLRAMSLEEAALAIHDSPNDALTFVSYGSKLLAAGYPVESEKACARAVELDPRMSRAHLGLGAARFRRGDLPSARAEFEQANRLDPNDREALMGLAQCEYRMGSGKRAIEALEKLVKLDPRNANAYYSMGKIYGELRQADNAYAALKKAEYWRDLGQVSRHYSRFAEAEEQLRKALKLNPNDAVAYYWIGQLYMQMGDTPKLRADAEQTLLYAITRDPTMPEPYYELGRLYERARNYRLAVVKYRKARELDLSDEKSLYHLGLCLAKLGQGAEGQKLVAAAKELTNAKDEVVVMQKRVVAEPRSPSVRIRLGDVYRKFGNIEGALKQFEAAQQLGATDAEVAQKIASCRSEMQRLGIRPGSMPTSVPLP